LISFIFLEAILLALVAPSIKISSKYLGSSKSFCISFDIGSILSTKISDSFNLNSEKFLA
jgi:hypothetical protein